MSHCLKLLFAALLACLALPAAAQSGRDVAQGSEAYVYEVDSLQNGAGAPGAPLDLETPMGLLESFMAAGRADDWARAAAGIDFTDVETQVDGVSRERVAAELYDLLNRSVSFSTSALPDRPDAVDTQTSSKDPMAGVARRSITLGRLELPGRSVPIRIARVRAPGGEPLWVFSRQTAANVPALYDRFGPTKFEKSLPPALRQQAFWTLAWWEVIALPLILIAAALAAALTYLAVRRVRKKFAEDGLWETVLQALHLPVTLLAFAGTFAIVRATFFRLSGPVKDLLDPLQLLLVIAAVVGILLSILGRIFDFATEKRTRELEAPGNNEDRAFYTKLSAIRRIVTAVLMLAAVGFLLVASDLNSTLGFSIIASAGVIGLVLVFAARQVLGDMMASVQIAFAQTAKIGDAVYFNDQWCYVEKIGFTHLRLRTWDEKRVIAPVADFVGSCFENWTKRDPSLMMHVELELDNRADVEALRGPFRSFVENDEDVIDPDDASVQVVGQSAKAMVVRFMARAEDPKCGWTMHCRLREHMLKEAARLDAASDREPAPAFLAREREVRMDMTAEEDAA
ncbi:mechanosensitive ion channel family protein [Pseudoblastomonas halimionae]|uniref:Mechanosensitive ion channel n=1 Tax=Alteriqipengyuania halimionae TaxID=1926630 RepID=A0A6I4U2A3_9SPHN|nr:mechanosensitive ion channel domain-containing protein [Alteriqipengyuania halimionae]MXP08631.1 mechanosensitive ion channel [Alteriqipengyuania halimionae]